MMIVVGIGKYYMLYKAVAPYCIAVISYYFASIFFFINVWCELFLYFDYNWRH